MSFKKALLAATVLSLPLAAVAQPAQAQPIEGLYIGAGVGGNFLHDRNSNWTGGGDTVRIGQRSDIGLVGLGSIGWGFGNGIRAEIEGSVRWNRVRRLSADGVNLTGVGGHTYQYGIMGNALYDIPTAFDLGGASLTPYVGLGAGYVWTHLRGVRGNAGGDQLALSGTRGRFAYQFIAGMAVGLNQFAPGLALTTEYRFMGTLPTRYTGTVTEPTGAATVGTGRVANYNHSILIGLRYAFNTPAPAVAAPAPAPAPAPARTFLVFFDWDRADLTDRARQIIAEAATNARTVGSTRIEVSGHADRTGGAAYNQRLSVRRAEAVASELVARGISRDEITVQGFGFDRPLVPTAQGVREPQNRRVEIVLR